MNHNHFTDLPNINAVQFDIPKASQLTLTENLEKPKILMLYGSLRAESYSRKTVEEAARILTALGAQTRIFDPKGLPLQNPDDQQHPKVVQLREWVNWSDGMVWCSPEIHGNMSGVLKTQIDWIPLSLNSIRPTQGKTLAVMQVCGGSQSFNVVNQLRVLGRWMRMLTIPNQSSVAKVYQEFDETGRMRDSSYYKRIVDVMEELVKFTLLSRGNKAYLTDRYSERVQVAENLASPLQKGAI